MCIALQQNRRKPVDIAVMAPDKLLMDLARLSSLAYEDQDYVDRAWSVAHGEQVGDIADPATVQKPSKKVALDPQHLEVLKRVEATPRLVSDGLTDAKMYVVEYSGDHTGDGSIMLIFRGTDSIQDAPRVKHGSDCVPKVPLEAMDFAHVTSETHIGSLDTHPDVPLMSDIPDHAIDMYIRCLANTREPETTRQEVPLHKEVVGAVVNYLHKWL
ncbi:hypothetical protein CVIRNUC_003538 [Coccomyxa viridis]|uniref:Uncharacterized protein n=1 Tax=Coccomyxa viridis TaxID=1274662 RepID=A0AAV1HZB9_9CHLO|nr:hypothetical protein CVIRNUC_003538 [Coccomyxa viridis]